MAGLPGSSLSFSTCHALAATLGNPPSCQSQLLSQGSDLSLCCSKRTRRGPQAATHEALQAACRGSQAGRARCRCGFPFFSDELSKRSAQRDPGNNGVLPRAQIPGWNKQATSKSLSSTTAAGSGCRLWGLLLSAISFRHCLPCAAPPGGPSSSTAAPLCVLVSKTLVFTEHEAGGELLPSEWIRLTSSLKAGCLSEGNEDLPSYFLLREKNLAQLIVGPLRGQISPTAAIVTFFGTFSSPSFPSFRGSPPSPISFSALQTLALRVLPAPFSGSACIHSEAFLAHLSLTSMSAASQPAKGRLLASTFPFPFLTSVDLGSPCSAALCHPGRTCPVPEPQAPQPAE